jgi:MoaA/NifB/PqqE/SkfB family radical SAM enzyme
MAKEIIDNHAGHAIVAILYFQGEPLLNPQWSEIVRYASEKRMFTILSTNGQFLDHENCEKIVHSGLNRLIVSADGVDQATYEKYRVSGNLDKIVKGLQCLRALKEGKRSEGHPSTLFSTIRSITYRRLRPFDYAQGDNSGHTERSRSMAKGISVPLNVRSRSLSGVEVNLSRGSVNVKTLRRKPTLVFQALLTKDTESQIKQIRRSALSWGADRVEFKTMQIYNQSSENLEKWLPAKKRFQRKIRPLRKGGKIVCWRAMSNAVYTSDGNLVPCCFDKLSLFSFGNYKQSVWFSHEREHFVNGLVRGEISPSICQNCTEA